MCDRTPTFAGRPTSAQRAVQMPSFFGGARTITGRCDDLASQVISIVCRLLCQLAPQLKTSVYVKLLLVIDDYNGCGKK